MSRTNEHSVKELITELLKSYGISDKFYEGKLRAIWSEVAGKHIEKHTKGIYFRSKKMYVNLDSAALKEELHYSREKLKKLINKKAGEMLVDEIFFK